MPFIYLSIIDMLIDTINIFLLNYFYNKYMVTLWKLGSVQQGFIFIPIGAESIADTTLETLCIEYHTITL